MILYLLYPGREGFRNIVAQLDGSDRIEHRFQLVLVTTKKDKSVMYQKYLRLTFLNLMCKMFIIIFKKYLNI